jgi:hypothetical protein
MVRMIFDRLMRRLPDPAIKYSAVVSATSRWWGQAPAGCCRLPQASAEPRDYEVSVNKMNPNPIKHGHRTFQYPLELK